MTCVFCLGGYWTELFGTGLWVLFEDDEILAHHLTYLAKYFVVDTEWVDVNQITGGKNDLKHMYDSYNYHCNWTCSIYKFYFD